MGEDKMKLVIIQNLQGRKGTITNTALIKNDDDIKRVLSLLEEITGEKFI